MNNSSPTLDCAAPFDDEQDRLARLLDEYLIAQEHGAAPARAEFLAQHPADAERLQAYLSGLDLLRAAAGPLAGSRFENTQVGQQIGEFRIERELGRGGMGVVYEAVQTSLGRRVALKVLPLAPGMGEKQLARFRNEAQAAAQAQHPNIVPVYAVGEDRGVHYYAMQLIPGRSLAEVLAGAGTTSDSTLGSTTQPAQAPTPLAGQSWPARTESAPMLVAAPEPSDLPAHLRQVASWGQQAAEALHAAHGCGVVHRDIKPSNLLLDESGKLWVTDFGVARRQEGAPLTQTGDVLGTMRYMSPEQARGQEHAVDARSDLYSLGVTLYELSAGRHPFADQLPYAQLWVQDAPPARSLQSWRPNIPRDFATVIHKAIAPEPADRYPSAQAFADDLGRFLAGQPVLAEPLTWRRRATKWAQRHRRIATAAAGVLMLAVTGLVVSVVLLSASNRRYLAEKDLATERLQATQQVLDRFAADTAEQLSAIPGAEGVRRQIYEESLAVYRHLATEASADPALTLEVASAYAKMGELTGKLGDQAGALQLLSQAEATLLSAPTSQSPRERNSALALVHAYRGALLCDRREYAAATTALESALEQSRQLVRAGSLPQARRQTAAIAANLSIAHAAQGQQSAAARYGSAAIADYQNLLAQNPSDLAVRRALAECYNQRGLLGSGEQRHPLADFAAAIQLQQALVEADPLDAIARSALARTWNNLGLAQATAKDWPGACESYRSALEWQQHLVGSSHHAVRHCRDLAVTLSNLGAALAQQGQLTEAVTVFKKSLAQYQRVTTKAPHDARTHSDAGSVGHNLSLVLWRQGARDQAQRCAAAALEFQRQAVTLAPERFEFQQRFSTQESLLVEWGKHQATSQVFTK